VGLINWIFDIYQHTQIDKAKSEAAAVRAELAAVRSGGGADNERLERVLGELALATRTVQRLMVEKGLCTHEEFVQALQRVDLDDGKADGRLPV